MEGISEVRPEEEPSQAQEDDPEQPPEHETLLRRPSEPTRSEEEPSSCHPMLLCLFVIFPAIAGIIYYFLNRIASSTVTPDTRSTVHDIVPPTILISIDGFRHEYLSRKHNSTTEFLAPTLNFLATTGIYADGGMQPVMPSETMPNHWSLVTGLFPESHGIISNTMYNPKTKKWFHHTGEQPEWWHGTPIWQTLRETPRSVFNTTSNSTETLTETYTAACVHWPGSNVKTHLPDAHWVWDRTVSYEKRVQRALDLLQGTAKDLPRPAQFVTLYYDLVDHVGHINGPHSPEISKEIQRVDASIKSLIDAIDKAGINANIVVVSDHGMTDISNDRRIDLTHVLEDGTVQDIRTSPLGLWHNVTISSELVHAQLQQYLRHEEHATVYLKKDIPDRWHIKNSPLVTDVITLASLGWSVLYMHQILVPGADNPLKKHPGSRIYGSTRHMAPPIKGKGNHGFDNTEEDMQAIFLAKGPSFREKGTVTGMRSVDLYAMLCHIFSATPSPNNGTLSTTVDAILKK